MPVAIASGVGRPCLIDTLCRRGTPGLDHSVRLGTQGGLRHIDWGHCVVQVTLL